MSTKLALKRLADSLSEKQFVQSGASLNLVVVFHIEQLDNDLYHQNLLTFLRAFTDITGEQAVATMMTPHSPILAERLARTGFSPEHYAERMHQVAELSLTGLHGHFVRSAPDASHWPMHSSFFDRTVIQEQLEKESDWLTSEGMMPTTGRSYSAGWWFMNSWLQNELHRLGYSHDYSLSNNRFNATPYASQALKKNNQEGIIAPPAICSIAPGGRPKAVFRWANALRAQQGKPLASLYSHDFDLNLPEAINAIEALTAANAKFHTQPIV